MQTDEFVKSNGMEMDRSLTHAELLFVFVLSEIVDALFKLSSLKKQTMMYEL